MVVDTCNYYPGGDGVRAALENGDETTSGLLQKALPRAVVVKAFNSVLASHLAKGGAATPDGERHALPIASDDHRAARVVDKLVEDAGFAALFAGPIGESWRFERARPGYCRALGVATLGRVLAETKRSDFVPKGPWRGERTDIFRSSDVLERSRAGGNSPINWHHDPGDEGGILRKQKGDDGGNLLGSSLTPNGMRLSNPRYWRDLAVVDLTLCMGAKRDEGAKKFKEYF